ncbi:MAG TPA: putative lipid II flippase FtsW [Gemmatimonadota bacterium]|nr:putative lipid II flippase FtsW [Gemmatimonadota bacterium]
MKLRRPAKTAPVRGPVDRRLRALTLLLVGFGLVMVYSASSVLSIVQYGESTVFVAGQVVKALMGILAMLVAARLDYRLWARLSKPLVWIATLLLLFLALRVGGSLTPEINGARRWIVVPGFAFQPIELAKLALVVWMAATIARKGRKIDRPSEGLVPLIVLPAVMAGLVLVQPDFKGAFMLGLLAVALLFLGGVRWPTLIRISAAGVPLAVVLMVLEPYRLRRLAAFFNPGEDIQGISYQINQSLISLGSGGWFGVGLGSSKQKFAFLPMAHTDFIVSIIGEELGLIGTLALLAAFLYLGALGYQIARQAPDAFGFLLASGITTLILVSALLNMGVATAALPTTGLPLPFVSYGGTALIVHLLAIGILLSISRDRVEEPHRERGSRR